MTTTGLGPLDGLIADAKEIPAPFQPGERSPDRHGVADGRAAGAVGPGAVGPGAAGAVGVDGPAAATTSGPAAALPSAS